LLLRHAVGKDSVVQKISALFQNYPRWTALIAGAASALGFEPWGLWPLTLICFALLIHLIAQAGNGKRAFMLGWLFGVGHFTLGNQWIAVAFTFQAAMPIWLGYGAVVALALFLAVYPALAACGAYWVARFANNLPHRKASIGMPLILAFAGFWIITEWLRSWVFTGYVWNPLVVAFVSDSFDLWLPWIGTYGASGLMILVSASLAVLAQRQWKTGFLYLALLALIIFGSIKINVTSQSLDEQPALTIAQPNISQADKYAPGYDAINFAKLAMNSRPLPEDGSRLILWPEAAIPDYLEDGYPFRYYQFQPGESAAGARARLARLMGEGDVLITGANRLVIQKGQLVAARNSISAMDANGMLLGHYDKAHLVPYGEYLPLPWLLRPLGLARLVPGDLDFWPGPGPQTMTINVGGKPVKVGMQICYEIIFSGEVVDRKNRPDFIFNPSNDAWFGAIGPVQFLAQARLRAIEEGLPVVRATPTGISAIIDADGRIIESLPLGQAGRIDARLPAANPPTLFARHGNILPLGFAVLLIAFALLPLAWSRTSR
jgi:apolipoprotein N-acyltransferase